MSIVKCINCGKNGHLYKTCNYPITSYGFICINIDNNNIKYLMVQRRHSFSYVEFIRGKYDLRHKNYILRLFAHMTVEEREKIKNNDFNYLWTNMWNFDNTNNSKNKFYNVQTKEYKDSIQKFNHIKNGYIIIDSSKNILIMDINYIMENTINQIDEPEYGFAKGRRNYNETDIQCAKREFYEETGYNPNWLNIFNTKPYEEVFTGMNGKRYKNVYYFCILDSKFINMNKFKNYSEIRKVCWFDYNQVQEHIQLINIERKELLKRVQAKILKNIIRYKDPNG